MKRRKNLERTIVLGLLLSTSVYGNAWAEGPITDNNWKEYENKSYTDEVLIENNSETEAAIKLENADNVTISLKTDNGHSITLDSEASGIRTQKNSNNGSITLNSGDDNIIKFSGEGNGIDADSNLVITLDATNDNNIESINADEDGGDGINIGANQSAKISFTAGGNNIIKVSSDGIYTEVGSTADSEYIAETGNNEITSGNNGIDHRGSGTITLKAEQGVNNITTTAGDGIRVVGVGDVTLTAKENKINAGDNGIQSETEGTISIISTEGDNNINAATTAIEVTYGNVIVNSINDVNLNTEAFNGNDVGAGIHLDYGNNNGYGTNEKALYVDIDAGGNFNIGSETTSATSGIQVDTFAGTVDIDAQKGVYMNVSGDNLIGATESGHININAKGDIILNAESNGAMHFMGYGYITNRNNQYQTDVNDELIGINGVKKSDVIIKTSGDIKFTGTDVGGAYYNIGIFATGTRGSVNHNTPVGDAGNEDNLDYIDENGYVKSDVNKTLLKANKIDMTISNPNGYAAIGILAQQSDNVFVNLESKIGTNLTALSENGNSIAIDTAEGNVTIKSTKGSNVIKAVTQSDTSMGIGIQTESEQSYVNHVYSNRVNLESKNNNEIYATTTAIANTGSDSIVDFDAEQGNNYIKAYKSTAIDSSNKSQTFLTSIIGNNSIEAGEIFTDEDSKLQYGKAYAINALSGSIVTLDAGNANNVYGAVYATGMDTKVNMKKFVPSTSTFSENNTGEDSTEVSNYVYSATVIDDAGDIDTTTQDNNKFYNKKFVSSLYAEDGANIELTGENYIGTWANNTLPEYLERTVWAYSKEDGIASTIKITGAAQIGTDNYEISPNSADVAIAAGTATDLDKTKVDSFGNTVGKDDKRSTVTVEYDNFAGGGYSSISGDILSAYAGLVDIKAKKDSNAGIRIEGNLLAGNNGILKIDLGNGGYFVGRTDDYQDAGNATDKGTVASDDHLKFYDPAFSSTIYSSGKIELDMGQGSTWDVTGQSWVTSLKGEGIIDMRNDNEDLSSGVTTNANETVTDNNSHAVHIGTLTGKHTFVMDLNDTSHDISDMLYIKDKANSSGTHKVFLNSVAGLEDMKDGDKLRFATVNAGADKLIFEGEYKGENGYTGSKSRAMLYDTGFNNAAFEIKNETYSTTDTENAGYNGESFGLTKPGNEYVDKEYGNTATNWYLTRNSSGDEMSDGGKTILNMSRANYSNAIYMDRLNKRLGEARYINAEEDEGMWVRIRHDRIGKDDAYRSQNTMYELGYDQKQESDNGERRVGFAVDYMHGDTSYSDIAGKGEIDRYGLWLYDTWMGDKGHYVDYVAKWGHLSNDFEIYNSREKVDGDYSNNVFSVSAEYGRKKDIGNDWYFEPQAQLQLARVTGADYTTNQGTKVSVDGINSLIGRAGFRIGKDFGEQKQRTLYFKADVLHEFLGDQTIRALDATTGGNWQSVDYDNQGTWYDIGIGYAAMMSKNSYAFIDLEQSFGNDNDETYQINAGVQWSF